MRKEEWNVTFGFSIFNYVEKRHSSPERNERNAQAQHKIKHKQKLRQSTDLYQFSKLKSL